MLMLALVPFVLSATAPEVDVRVVGALRSVVREGKTGGLARLSALNVNKTTVGLGALAALDGEATILHGDIHLARPRNGKAVASSGDAEVCLFVMADVPEWGSVRLSEAVTWAKLDRAIEDTLRRQGLDTAKRIPFLLEGEFRNLNAHVVDGSKLPKGPSSHEQHIETAVQFASPKTKGTIVGFFSKSDQGVFTHHTTTTHLHCVLPAEGFSGHVDEVALSAGATLRFPKP